MTELTPHALYDYLESMYFVGVDPSCLSLMTEMKKCWEDAGRPSTHFYQGFREIRWESVRKTLSEAKPLLFDEATGAKREAKDKTALVVIKEIVEKLVMRDGFKIGGEANYVIENWENTRHAQDELVIEGRKLLESVDEWDLSRLSNPNKVCYDDWLLDKNYSPDRAEKFRGIAREQLIKQQGVK